MGSNPKIPSLFQAFFSSIILKNSLCYLILIRTIPWNHKITNTKKILNTLLGQCATLARPFHLMSKFILAKIVQSLKYGPNHIILYFLSDEKKCTLFKNPYLILQFRKKLLIVSSYQFESKLKITTCNIHFDPWFFLLS